LVDNTNGNVLATRWSRNGADLGYGYARRLAPRPHRYWRPHRVAGNRQEVVASLRSRLSGCFGAAGAGGVDDVCRSGNSRKGWKGRDITVGDDDTAGDRRAEKRGGPRALCHDESRDASRSEANENHQRENHRHHHPRCRPQRSEARHELGRGPRDRGEPPGYEAEGETDEGDGGNRHRTGAARGRVRHACLGWVGGIPRWRAPVASGVGVRRRWRVGAATTTFAHRVRATVFVQVSSVALVVVVFLCCCCC